MPRKRQSEPSTFEHWRDALADAPAWAGPVVAGGVFLVLRYLLPGLLPAPAAGTLDPTPIVRAFLPLVAWTVAGGMLVVWVSVELDKLKERLADRRLFSRQAGIGDVRRLSWREFERVVGEAYRRRGYAARVVGGDGVPDGGVDIELSRPGEVVLVQCKHGGAYRVGVGRARELIGVVVSRGATRGILVTSGRFTADTRAFADRNPRVELVDGARLADLLAGTPVVGVPHQPPSDARTTTPRTPACPACGSAMVLRTSGRGPTVGSRFWGCPRYPACRGTRNVIP